VTRTALDHTGEFMAGHDRPGQPRVADTGLGEPVQIGSAQADCGDADEFLSRTNGRDGLGVHSDIAHTVQSGCLHRFQHT
jgi:hypothetical protein